ncbi:hypothetical protein [Sinomonas sp.]|jgi:ketosteroid isomerase-like protein|uniref:hypothetical protein n=1 Tax=Sinomonas sp. TaxID=1914986 RepID=UPI003F7F0055
MDNKDLIRKAYELFSVAHDFLPKLARLSGSTYAATLIDVADGGRHTVAIHRGQAERDGNSIDNISCNVFRIEDGLIQAVHTYPWDARAMDAFGTSKQLAAS